jgi:hypothetical protein
MILGGIFFTLVGFASAFTIGLYAGLFLPSWEFSACCGSPFPPQLYGIAASLRSRSDSSGMTLPTGSVFRPGQGVHIPREGMATIARDELRLTADRHQSRNVKLGSRKLKEGLGSVSGS